MKNTTFLLGVVTGILLGFTVSILSATVLFHMHLDQMDEVRADHLEHASCGVIELGGSLKEEHQHQDFHSGSRPANP